MYGRFQNIIMESRNSYCEVVATVVLMLNRKAFIAFCDDAGVNTSTRLPRHIRV